MPAELQEGVIEYQLIGASEEGNTDDLLVSLSGRDGRQRLQALIAEWLRMENLVVLAGAGTSVTCGGKTMAVLERAILETVQALPGIPSKIRPIIAARLESSIHDVTSQTPAFEDWFSYLVSATLMGSAPESPFGGVQWKGFESPAQAELSWLVDKIGKAIFAECALTLPDTTPSPGLAGDIAPHLAFLSKLVVRDSNLGRVHLFTLNYDTLFEQALELLGIQYSDGFTGKAEARFDPSVYGLDVYYPGEVSEGRVRRFDKFLHFYKLHGSIHWHLRGNELRARHPDLRRYADYGRVGPAEKAAKLEEFAADLPAVGILPTANKFAQTLAMPFAHLFRSFQIRLSTPQTFFLVLGYGFGDQHVGRIIEAALMNPSLVMLVVDPNPKSGTVARIQRYKHLGKRAFLLTPTEAAFGRDSYKFATFDDFARSVMPDVRWLNDFLRLRRFEKQIQASERQPETEARVEEPE